MSFKLFSYFFVFIILVSSVSALQKSYDSSTRTVTLTQGKNVVFQARLLSDPVVMVKDHGSVYQKVAEIELITFPEVSFNLDDFNFYNRKDFSLSSRDFDLRYRVFMGYESFFNTHEECDSSISFNGSLLYDCFIVIDPPLLVPVYSWVPFSNVNELEQGSVIGLFFDVLPGDSIEWIPSFLGVDIFEWAVLLEGSPIEYYTGSDNNAVIVDDINDVAIQSFTIGTLTADQDYTLKGVSISVSKFSGCSAGETFNVAVHASNGSGFPVDPPLAKNSTIDCNYVPTSYATDSWINITLDSEPTLSSSTEYVLVVRDNDEGDSRLTWHYNNAGGSYAGGFMAVSNNNGTSWSFVTSDYDAKFEVYGSVPSESNSPNVTDLVSFPVNGSVYLSGQVYNFSSTVVDDSSIDSVLFEFDGVNYTAVNDTASVYNYTFSSLSAGSYSYRWYVNDSSGNVNNTEGGSYTVLKSSLKPSAFVDHKATSYVGIFNYTSDLIYLNGSLSGSQILLYLDGVLINNGTSPLFNITNLTYGSYYFNVSFLGNENYSASQTSILITIDPFPFYMDFSNLVFVGLFLILFVIACLLFYNQLFAFSGIILMILGFVLFFSDFNYVLSFIMIVLGVLASFVR